jgi:exodeoxyribonuclease-3
MILASWNVNSVRARRERLLRWLDLRKPDVLCLQEIKVPAEEFPLEEVRALGYRAALHGQKAYNGVAILARTEPEQVQNGFGDDGDESQSRLLAATVDGVRIVSVYAPNGHAVGSEKWNYKLAWLERLRLFVARQPLDRPLALCGDFNVAPEPRDVHDPHLWEGTVLFHPQARAALERIVRPGLHDTFRRHHQEAGRYSWWDYRMLGFPKNRGLRIDLILASAPLVARCTGAGIDRDERKGTLPSDHAPVCAEFEGP